MTLAEPFARRIEALRAGLAARGLEAALIGWAPHVRYLSGIVSAWAPAFLIIDAQDIIAVVPESAGIAPPPGVRPQTYVDGSLDAIVSPRANALAMAARLLRAGGIDPTRLGVERERLALAGVDAMPDLPRAADIGPLLARLRMRKDEEEIARIRANLRVLEAGFEAARATIRPGVSELAVWAALHEAMMSQVGAPFPLEGNLASGPRTLENEPQATNRRIDAGDSIFIDLYPVIDGYAADLTRAFVAGRPTAAQRERHGILTDALETGAAMLRPGVRACDVDQAVRARVAAALGGYVFPHHTGHALGLESQERPMLIPGDETLLEAGMVIAIEPGAYLPDTGGMRVERNYLITESGSESLSDYPIDLFACG